MSKAWLEIETKTRNSQNNLPGQQRRPNRRQPKGRQSETTSFSTGDLRGCESNDEWERLLYPHRKFSYRFKRGKKEGTLETGATSRDLSCHVDINVANSNRNCQPNRAHHQVCIEHLCSNLCWPGLNPHDLHCPLSLHRVESTSLRCPFTSSTLPSFQKVSLQTDADVSMRTSRIGVEAKFLAGFFFG